MNDPVQLFWRYINIDNNTHRAKKFDALSRIVKLVGIQKPCLYPLSGGAENVYYTTFGVVLWRTLEPQ